MFFYTNEDLLTKKELLSQLPPEARAAYNGTPTPIGDEWEWSPDTAETAARVRMSHDGWHKYYIEHGIEIEEGEITQVYYRVDMPSGDWTRIREAEWGSDEHIESHKEFYERVDHEQMWDDYYKWAARNGKDPLGELLVDSTETIRWRLCLAETKEGVTLEAARRISPPSDKTPQYMRAGEIPDALSRYLLLEKRGGEGAVSEDEEAHLIPDRVDDKEDLLALVAQHDSGTPVEPNREREPTLFPDGTRLSRRETFFLDVEITEPIPDDRYQNNIREAAREACNSSIEQKNEGSYD